jgi:hypothetical protein
MVDVAIDAPIDALLPFGCSPAVLGFVIAVGVDPV